jgi:multicomponent Na+:H+ antiporter subunit C
MLDAPNLVLLVVIATLFAGGVYLLLERSLSRVLIGIILLSNGTNLFMLVVSGPPGGAPIVGLTPEGQMSDPLPQAMVLTAIVITLGMSAFILAMAYRSWQLNRHDEVQDDLEDRRLARLAATDQVVEAASGHDGRLATLDQEAAEARDEIAEMLTTEGDEAGDQA